MASLKVHVVRTPNKPSISMTSSKDQDEPGAFGCAIILVRLDPTLMVDSPVLKWLAE